MNCSHIEEVTNEKLWPGPSAPRVAGGLRNPEHDPNRALRQRSRVSQASLARAWPNSGCIMKRANEAVISHAQNAAPQTRALGAERAAVHDSQLTLSLIREPDCQSRIATRERACRSLVPARS